MNFIKRAILYLTAKKGKTALLTLVFTAILVFVLAGLTIRQASITATENAKKEVGATVTLAADREKMMQEAQKNATASSSTTGQRVKMEMTPVSIEEAEKIAKLDGVKSYAFSASATATAESGITAITSDTEEESTTESSSQENNSPEKFGGGMPKEMGNSSQMNADFRLTGVNNQEGLSIFADGTAKITSGRGIDETDKGTNNVVIESQLATANDLKVGSSFKIKDSNAKVYEVKIVGIYETSQSVDGMAARMKSMNPANTIYTYYTLANTLKGDDTAGLDSAIYNLEDPSEMTNFVEKANKLIDTSKFSLTTNDQMYQQMLTPLNNVASFATNIVLLVAGAGVIILSLIVILSIRERKFEIGVLMSLGENKLKIIGQFFAELLIIMIVGVALSAVTGNFIGNSVGNQLLTQQNATQEEQQASNTPTTRGTGEGNRGGGMRMSGIGNPFATQKQAEQIKSMNVKMTPKVILILGAMALGIVLVAIFVASIGILRMEPKTILTSN
ncbi:putative ABC transport system permease protein [Pilibacter termitis]|uniref:Putative ABC transport system permease protein n=1 Tax=Pilibacter termitis TaxID=263852 RepID=A0A1T4QIP7_9ENTE|nr:ABC transporter permease [Pilibacter termitis]SKA03516.1 putative ABC transport system permease protein [Pilibacter termitis]